MTPNRITHYYNKVPYNIIYLYIGNNIIYVNCKFLFVIYTRAMLDIIYIYIASKSGITHIGILHVSFYLLYYGFHFRFCFFVPTVHININFVYK